MCKHTGKIKNWISGFIFASFIFMCIFYTVKDFAFAFNDDTNQLVMFFFQDKYIPISNRLDFWSARFLPMQFFDYNILPLLGFTSKNIESAVPVFMMLKFLLLIALFFLVFKEINIYTKTKFNFSKACFSILSLAISANFLFVILYPSFSEITQGIFVLLFFLFMLKAYRTGKRRYFIISLFSAIYSMYMKETMFVIYFAFAMTELLFDKRLNKRQKIFNYALIANCVIFLLLYYFIVFINRNDIYPEIEPFSISEIFAILKSEWYMNFIILISAYRGIRILFFKDRKYILFDSILFAGASYGISYIILGAKMKWYYVISLYIFAINLYQFEFSKKIYSCIIYFLLSIAIVFGVLKNNHDNYWHIKSRKNTIWIRELVRNKRIYGLTQSPKNKLEDYCWDDPMSSFTCWNYFTIAEYVKYYSKSYIQFGNNKLLQKAINDGKADFIFIHRRLIDSNYPTLNLKNYKFIIEINGVNIYQVKNNTVL
ncbi:MAG: hypothetical protein IJ473_01155 [Alphaproteobacteria bacterium]|nr:hypothetical protein [Alphaproteobacteria bacterium]